MNNIRAGVSVCACSGGHGRHSDASKRSKSIMREWEQDSVSDSFAKCYVFLVFKNFTEKPLAVILNLNLFILLLI